MSIIPKRKALRFLSRVAVGVLSLVLVVFTAAPLVRSDAWWIRVFDFPRLQIAVLMGLALVSYTVLRLNGRLRPWEYALAVVLILALVWQLIFIAPYTAIYPKQMSDSHAEDESNRISILIFNVFVDNREVEALRDLIRDTDPDIILLSEATQWWYVQLKVLEKDYPHTLHQPLENEYGKLFYSRMELEGPEIRFLIEPDIPSILSQVRLRSGKLITLLGVHPRPPGIMRPKEEEKEDGEREDTDNRNAELLLVAKEVEELGDVPVIVTGDFNDVSWSRTTRLFQRTGGLLDPRVGRGLFNTFNTESRLLRYPLDHVFASKHFLLVELRRLPDIGSDHFPMLVVLDYDPGISGNDEPQPDDGDKQVADDAIKEGKNND